MILLACGAFWQTDAGRAVELARTGNYEEAAAALETAVAGGNTDPDVVQALYHSWIRMGQYSKARERFETWSASNAAAGPIRLAAGRIHRLSGNYAQAIAHLDSILNSPQVGVAASWEKALALEETGKRDEAEAIFKRLIDGFLNGAIGSSPDLLYVARSMWATEYFHDANDVFKLLTGRFPRDAEAFVAWGDLLAEKYNDPEAIASYQDALAIDPNMPESNLGVARLLALTDPEKSSAALEKTLSVNPNFMDAHLLVAEMEIDAEQYEKAEESINKVLAVNPQSAHALSLLASINFLRNDKEKFNQYVQQVLKLNPYYSELYYILAENCVSLRLYSQAVEFAREALRLNPRDWRAQSTLGVNLLRLGEEVEGKNVLEQAYKGDPFNVLTVNTLTLLDSFENFDRFQSEHFQVKLHKKESAPLRPQVLDLLEKAHKDLSAKYKFTPQGPITFEMFPDHADFAVRTFGLPGIGALGVCFGKLVAMDSPSARTPDTFNWGSTLWHEFTHVITLQITDHKVPRWFSEGLSVFEERKAFPGWGDDLKLEYLKAVKEKRLLPIGDLNDGFTRPKFPEQVLVSYYQASIVADYIEERFGFPAILRMLALYKEGRNTEAVFMEALNLSLTDFDTAFLKWVDDRTRAIEISSFTDLVGEGEELMAKGETDMAIDVLSRAVTMYPEYTDEHNPYVPLAEAYLKKGDKKAAIDTLKKYLTYSETAYSSHIRLAELLEEAGDISGAAQALEGALYIRPLDIPLHQKLGGILLGQKQFGGAVREFETLIALNAPDRAGAYYRLAEAYFGQGNRADARRNVLRALEIAPSYEPAQELLLKLVR
jgi:tetratricopeptide (TPR) repeat protein